MKKVHLTSQIIFLLSFILLFSVQIPKTDAVEAQEMNVDELKSKLESGADITVVDTRSEIFFEREHIKGAISISETELKERCNELPRGKEIVLYHS